MGLFDRLKERLTRTREALSDNISKLFKGGRPIDRALLDELEELLYQGDLGPIAGEVMAEINRLHERGEIKGEDEVRSVLREVLLGFVAPQGVVPGEAVLQAHPTVILEKDPHIPATTAQHPAIDEPDFPAAVPDEQCRAAAQAAFNLLASFSQMRPQRPRFFIDRWRNLAGVWTGIRTVEDACLEMRWSQAFEELQPLIRRAPFDKTLLLTFARMCEYSQFPDLCLQVLQILNQQYPNDHVVLRGLARITQCLGGYPQDSW